MPHPVHSSQSYYWVKHIVEDWKSDILNITLPKFYGLGTVKILQEIKNNVGTEAVLEEMDKLKYINILFITILIVFGIMVRWLELHGYKQVLFNTQ